MSAIQDHPRLTPRGVSERIFALPPALERLTFDGTECAIPYGDVLVRIKSGQHASRLSVRLQDVRRLDGQAFAARVQAAYHAAGIALRKSPHGCIARLWNGIPGIHDRVDDDGARDRYMAFNAGRYAAMREWFGHDADLAEQVPAASGIGVAGEDFVLHALALGERGQTIQNPRQVPAAHYSAKFGPLPPCFARATLTTIAGRPSLLVSGTAAIIGEASMHLGNIERQIDVTLANMAALVREAQVARSNELAAFDSLRIYVPDAAHDAIIRAEVHRAFPNVTEPEFVRAELCRRELLVEVEGTAGPVV